ncbi:hypothetical protein BQ8482_110978 [Mesorhizobium delmotii]|uniref:Uncharacterized protein n=1 Tax=Mesorhizobium delmotii TaxID=1631247 RepID=A0A2P9AD34_9HYPH|nr:hypothetical protein BQ8482_110978 [Mesorhizobium delmotii]
MAATGSKSSVRLAKFSECMIYGRYVDDVLDGAGHFHGSEEFCRVHWTGEALSDDEFHRFVAAMAPEQVAIGRIRRLMGSTSSWAKPNHSRGVEASPQVSISIRMNLSAGGESDAPRRRTTPIVREISGSRMGLVTRNGWSPCGVAMRGRTDIPRPASTRPSDVERCVTS